MVRIKAIKDGYVPTSVTWNYRNGIPITPPTNYTLSLEPGTTNRRYRARSRRATDRRSDRVCPRSAAPSKRPEPEPIPDIWDYPNQTDENGRWHYDIMPAELSDVWIRLAHPDYASDTGYGSHAQANDAQLRDGTGVMVLKKGLPVSGIVRDAQGQSLAGAVVAQGADRWGSRYPDTETDREGRFRFRARRAG